MFRMFFIRSSLPMTPYEPCSFMEIGPHVFPKAGTQTDTHTDAATLYVYIEVVKEF